MNEEKKRPVGRPVLNISQETKLRIIEKLDLGIKKIRICRDFNISPYLLRKIIYEFRDD